MFVDKGLPLHVEVMSPQATGVEGPGPLAFRRAKTARSRLCLKRERAPEGDISTLTAVPHHAAAPVASLARLARARRGEPEQVSSSHNGPGRCSTTGRALTADDQKRSLELEYSQSR